MWSILVETARILAESAVYLLFGFGLAGLLHVLLSRTEWLTRRLNGQGTGSVVMAAVLGVPLPLCSCSVLPAGLTLRRRGASKGATASFLISVPETDVVSIALTYGLLGPVMAVFRPLASLITAIVTGCLINVIERFAGGPESGAAQDDQKHGCEERKEYDPTRGILWNAGHYGFVQFFDDIIVSLLVGIVLGGAITALLPDMGLERLPASSPLTMLAMLVVGIPMYVCATSSTPIAAGLIAAGLSPGAALVFLLAGPATNLASLIVLYRYLGRLTLIVYLVCIAVISVLMGVWLDNIVASAVVPGEAVTSLAAVSSPGPVRIVGAIVLGVLAWRSLRRTEAFGRALGWVQRRTGLAVSSALAKTLCGLILVAAYLCSGFLTVQAGQRAAVTTFGRKTASDLGPGLHYRWPYPIGAADIASVRQVKRVELGFRSWLPDPNLLFPADTRVLTGESWMLTGKEDIVDIKWVVQYRVRDSQAGFLNYIYGVADQPGLASGAAESALRQAVGSRDIDTLLTTARHDVEAAVAVRLQDLLDRCDAGMEVVNVHLQDVHAPPDVHAAFRDVASAAEDKARAINNAYEYDERVVREAAGEAATRVASAEANRAEIVERSSGEGNAFLDQLEAFRVDPGITRLRLYFESVDVWLPWMKKYIDLAGDAGPGVDLWLVPGRETGEVPIPPTIPQAGRADNLRR